MISLLAAVALLQYPGKGPADPAHFYDGDSFEQLDRRGTAAARIQALCVHRSPLTINGLADQQDRLTTAKDRPASGSLELGCTRALLYSIGAPGREGPEMAPGASWAAGAIAELERRAEHHPEDIVAVQVLALVTQEAVVPTKPAYRPVSLAGVATDALANRELPRIAGLVYRSAQRDGTSALLLRSCASLMLNVADFEAAHDCNMRALSAGLDSTWHLERLAYLAFLRADTTAGLAFFRAAERAATDSASRADLGWHLEPASRSCRSCVADGLLESNTMFNPTPAAWLSGEERSFWFSLHSLEIPSWITAAWRQRKPTAATTSSMDDGLVSRRMSGATPDVVAVVKHGSAETTALAIHFQLTSYTGGVFAPCGRTLDESCSPSLIGDPSHHIGFQAAMHRLWNPATGAAINVVPFGIRREDVAFAGTDSISVIRMEIRRWAIGANSSDTSFLTGARRPRPGDNTQTFLGLVTLPDVGAASWSVAVSDTAGLRRGNRFGDEVTRAAGDSIDASDVILGSKDQGITWRGARKDVLVAPQNVFARHKPVELYYQVRRTAGPLDAKVAFAVRAADEGKDTPRPPLLGIASALHVVRGINEVQREFDLSRLNAGSYELEIVTTAAGGIVIRRTVTFKLE